jgi:hypothetical protein
MSNQKAAWLMRIEPGSLYEDYLILRDTKPQLGIQFDVVVREVLRVLSPGSSVKGLPCISCPPIEI